MTDNFNNTNDSRSSSILLALDSLHRSLLFKNMQFEDNKEPNKLYMDNNIDSDTNEVKSEYPNFKKLNTIQLSPFPPTPTELTTNLENIKNSACEKINKKCVNGLCYCFSSDSDDYVRRPRDPVINLFRRSKGAGTFKIPTYNSLSGFSSEETKSSHDEADDYDNNDEDDEFFTSLDFSNGEDYPVQLNSSDSIILRKSSFRKKRDPNRKSCHFEVPKDTVNGVDVACQTVQSQNKSKTIKIKISTTTNGRDTELHKHELGKPAAINSSPHKSQKSPPANKTRYSESSSISQQSKKSIKSSQKQRKSEPAIHIVQELSESMTITSTVTMNKTQIKKLQNFARNDDTKPTTQKSPKLKKPIIDDNFCNEILDKLNKSFTEDDSIISEGNVTNTTMSDEYFVMGKLDSSPKYSGKTMGDLYARRLKKLEKLRSSRKISFDDVKPRIPEVVSESSADSGGPQKPPRTFASSLSNEEQDELMLYNRFQNLLKNDVVTASDQKYGWNIENNKQIKVEPSSVRSPDHNGNIGWSFENDIKIFNKIKTEELNDNRKDIGWKSPKNIDGRSGNWAFAKVEPAEPNLIYNMLNYENNPQMLNMMESNNLKPCAQYSKEDEIPPKENIDEVDSSVFRLTTGNSPKKKLNDFDYFVKNTTIKSTPEKHYDANVASFDFINHEQEFENRRRRVFDAGDLDEIRQHPLNDGGDMGTLRQHGDETICSRCFLKKSKRPSFRKNPIKRTKTFLEKSIPKMLHYKKRYKPNLSESDVFTTPQKCDVTSNLNQNGFNIKASHSKKLEFTPVPRNAGSQSVSSNTTPLRKKTLNFNDHVKRISPDDFNFDRVISPPRANKKLKSLTKISPRRLFDKNGPKTETNEQYETYKSFADDDKTGTILMKQYLSEIRDIIESVDNVALSVRHVEIENEMHDIENEPIYEEIPKSLPQKPPRKSLHYTANNNPNAIYTQVDKTRKENTNQQCRRLTSLEHSYLQEKQTTDVEDKLMAENVESISKKSQRKNAPMRPTSLPIAPSQSYISNGDNIDEISSYDASRFLRDALGDDVPAVNNGTNRFDDYDTVDEYTTFNISNSFQSNKPSPLEISLYSTNQNSSTNSRFNNSAEIYRTVKNKLRNSFRRSKSFINNERRKLSGLFDDRLRVNKSPGNISMPQLNSDELDKYKSTFNDRKAERMYQTLSKLSKKQEISDAHLINLITQISNQRSARNQLSNALSICRSSREFESSPELIEAERLMLVSNLKENAAKHELVLIDYENNGQVCKPSKRTGAILINNIECTVKDIIMKDAVFRYYYICVCSHNSQVISTQATEGSGDKIRFPNCQIHFRNLEPDYEIKIEMFALRLRKNVRNYSHESRFHINKEPKNFLVGCPSPSKLSPVNLFHPSGSTTLPKKFTFDVEFSRFKSQGLVELTSFSFISGPSGPRRRHEIQRTIKNVGNSYIFCIEDCMEYEMASMTYNSNLENQILIELRSETIMENREIEGFLTVGEGVNEVTYWNRRWCKLDGLCLYFWNYPEQNYDHVIFTLDLIKCVQEDVQLVDRELCARPRTFAIEMFTSCDDKTFIKSYYLSADNQVELSKWTNALNYRIRFLRDWKI